MPRLISIFLLIVFTAYIFRPLYPYLDYALNQDYIAKVLCINKEKPKLECNGKCHLAKQLKKVSEEENPTSPDAPSRVQTKEIVVFFEKHHPILPDAFVSAFNLSHTENIHFNFSQFKGQPLTPPPEQFLS